MIARGTGHLLDRERDRDAMRRARSLVGAAPTPGARENVRLERLLRAASDPVLGSLSAHPRDQGSINSCTGHWLARSSCAWHLARGIARPYPSAAGAYRLGRATDRIDDREPLADVGARPSAVLGACQEIGLASEAEWPEDPMTTDDEPTPEQIRRSAGAPVGVAHDVREPGRGRIFALCAATDLDLPWGIAIQVDEAFQDDDGLGPVIDSIDLGRVVGSHMLTGVGYRVLDGGEILLRVSNSYGLGWRDGGYAWLHEQLVADPFLTRDVTVLDVAEAP